MKARQHLAIMVKEPRMGAVKTRLARGMGLLEATRFYRSMSGKLIDRLAQDSRWEVSLWIAPKRAVTNSHLWPNQRRRYDQGLGDIGERMLRPFRRLPKGHVVLVGSDIPDLGPDQVAAAFRALGHADLVFGPALDGGFWLIGMRASGRLCNPFRTVRWSSRFALGDVRANLRDKRVAVLATLADIDTLEDYRNWRLGSQAMGLRT